MLAAVRWGGVVLGAVLGVLALAGVSLALWLVLSGLGVEGAVGAATTFGTLAGFAVAGWFAGRRSAWSPWFHGALAALVVAAIVIVTSLRGGSPAPTPTVLLLALLATTVGATSAFLSTKRDRSDPLRDREPDEDDSP